MVRREKKPSWRWEKVSFNLFGLSGEDWLGRAVAGTCGSGEEGGTSPAHESWLLWAIPGSSISCNTSAGPWGSYLNAVICSFLGTKQYWTTCVQRTNSDCLLWQLWLVAASSIWHIYGSVLALCEPWFAGCSWPLSCCSDFPVSALTLCFLIVFLNSSNIQGLVVILQL